MGLGSGPGRATKVNLTFSIMFHFGGKKKNFFPLLILTFKINFPKFKLRKKMKRPLSYIIMCMPKCSASNLSSRETKKKEQSDSSEQINMDID